MHVIRLRGPWEHQPLARTVLLEDGATRDEPGELPPAGKMQMPADWSEALGADFRGRVRFTRPFNSPTGLTDEDRVSIAIDEVDAFGSAALNGHSLGDLPPGGAPARFDVTQLLKLHNRLVVEVELPRLTSDSPPLPRPNRQNLPGGLIGEVRLEIE